MDYIKEIEDLKEKIEFSKSEINLSENVLKYRELCNELKLRREQVLHLKKELQEANSKNFELNRDLETNKSFLMESEFNLKLSLQKSTTIETKFKEVNDLYINLKVKEQMRLSEIDILKQNIQKMAHDNYRLSKEVEELSEKLKYSVIFNNELEQRQTKFNAVIANIRSATEKLEKEQEKIIQLDKKIQITEQLEGRTMALMQENERLREEHTKMEQVIIQKSTKIERLCSLLKESSTSSVCHPITGKIKYLQWESQCKSLREKNNNSEQIIKSLTNSINKEVEANAELLLQIENNETRDYNPTFVIKKELLDVIEIE